MLERVGDQRVGVDDAVVLHDFGDLTFVFKYLASSALSLRLSGARWRQYLAAQAPGVTLAGLVFVVAMATRLAFEAMGAGELVTFLGIATAICARLGSPVIWRAPVRVCRRRSGSLSTG